MIVNLLDREVRIYKEDEQTLIFPSMKNKYIEQTVEIITLGEIDGLQTKTIRKKFDIFKINNSSVVEDTDIVNLSDYNIPEEEGVFYLVKEKDRERSDRNDLIIINNPSKGHDENGQFYSGTSIG